METKTCTKCKETKLLSEFPKSSRNKSGYLPRCKKCSNAASKKYRDDNKEVFNERRREYYQENIEKIREQKNTNAAKFKDKKAEYDKIYREDNKIKIAEYKKSWEKVKRETDPLFKIKTNLRRRILHALNGTSKSDHTLTLLGCSPEEFKIHLENQFSEGMTWNNYGTWHIDHIKPCYLFDLTISEEQFACFNYKNQRPLWAVDNLTRSKSLTLDDFKDNE